MKRAILKNPEILILDEPTTALTLLISNQINILIKKNCKKKIRLLLTPITHDMTSVNEYGMKRVALQKLNGMKMQKKHITHLF